MPKFSDIHWLATIKTNLVRALSASLIAILIYIALSISGTIQSNTPIWAGIVAWGLMFPLLLFLVLIFKIFSLTSLPFTRELYAFVSLLATLFIVIGDPLIWAIIRYHPTLVPTDRFRFINFHALILIEKPDPSLAFES